MGYKVKINTKLFVQIAMYACAVNDLLFLLTHKMLSCSEWSYDE